MLCVLCCKRVCWLVWKIKQVSQLHVLSLHSAANERLVFGMLAMQALIQNSILHTYLRVSVHLHSSPTRNHINQSELRSDTQGCVCVEHGFSTLKEKGDNAGCSHARMMPGILCTGSPATCSTFFIRRCCSAKLVHWLLRPFVRASAVLKLIFLRKYLRTPQETPPPPPTDRRPWGPLLRSALRGRMHSSRVVGCKMDSETAAMLGNFDKSLPVFARCSERKF